MDLSTPIDKQYRRTNIMVVGQESETTAAKQTRTERTRPEEN